MFLPKKSSKGYPLRKKMEKNSTTSDFDKNFMEHGSGLHMTRHAISCVEKNFERIFIG